MQFVDLHASKIVSPAKAGVAGVDDGHEGVAHRSSRSARDADEHLVHEGRASPLRGSLPDIAAHTRRLSSFGPVSGKTEARRDLGDRAAGRNLRPDPRDWSLRPVSGEGMARNADRADSPEALA